MVSEINFSIPSLSGFFWFSTFCLIVSNIKCSGAFEDISSSLGSFALANFFMSGGRFLFLNNLSAA